jgi:hypothetical protein
MPTELREALMVHTPADFNVTTPDSMTQTLCVEDVRDGKFPESDVAVSTKPLSFIRFVDGALKLVA